MKHNKNAILRKVVWVLTILYIAIIFYMSSRPIELSRQDSAWFMSAISIVESEDEAMDIHNQQMMDLQNLVRKNIHMIIFAGLGMLYFVSLYGYFGKICKTAVISLALTILFAVTDEIHQIFSNRGASFTDVLLDSLGGVIGILLVSLVFGLIEKYGVLKKFFEKLYDFDPRYH